MYEYININAVIHDNYGETQDLIFLFRIPTGTLKNFFDIYRQFGHTASETFVNSDLGV